MTSSQYMLRPNHNDNFLLITIIVKRIFKLASTEHGQDSEMFNEYIQCTCIAFNSTVTIFTLVQLYTIKNN